MSGRFDELPGLIEAKLAEHARVVLVYFDAFGWRFLERHADHPLFAGAEVERWSSCFPSTTTVHSTTIHSGLPLGEHGLYEWNVYEPRLDRLVTPLWFCFAGDEPGTLFETGFTPHDLFPEQTLYRRLLPLPSHVAMPTGIARSATSNQLLRPATVHSFDDNADGLARLCGALAGEERAYGTIYLGDADALMHMAGPDAPAVAELMEETLSAIEAAPWPEGTLVLLTADHGMEGISPERTAYVNSSGPSSPSTWRSAPTASRSRLPAPAATSSSTSCPSGWRRSRPGSPSCSRASRRCGRSSRCSTQGLFGSNITEALTSRLANLVVLPGPGEAAYWFEEGRFEQRFFGQHGGLSANEMEIPLVSWVAGG